MVPSEYIPGVEKGVQGVWESGALIGFPFLDTRVTLFDAYANAQVELKIGTPRVAYRATLARGVGGRHTHKKQADGASEFAGVKLRLEPNEAGAGNEFQSKILVRLTGISRRARDSSCAAMTPCVTKK